MELLTYRDRQLHFEGKPLKTLAEELGTPFFLLSEKRIRANYEALVRGFSSTGLETRVRYCSKTNNEAAVLKILAACGGQVLVSHLAEAQLALDSGFSSHRIAYQRPVLREQDICELLSAGIDFLHAFRLADLEVMESAASRVGKRTRVSLRLRADSLARGFSPLGFLSRRLGIRKSEILAAAGRIGRSRWLSLAGINFYQGTQQERVECYLPLLRRAMALAGQLHSQMGIRLEEINLGGGIPSPSLRRFGLLNAIAQSKNPLVPGDPASNLERFARQLAAAFHREVQAAHLPSPPALAVEPGRAIAGNSGILVTRIRAITDNWLFLDASRNHLGESPVLLVRAVVPVTPPDGGRRFYHLSGSTLNTMDFIGLWRRLPRVVEGDLLVLCDAGAYSISRASRYAGLSPAVYLVRDTGLLQIIRRAEALSDLSQIPSG